MISSCLAFTHVYLYVKISSPGTVLCLVTLPVLFVSCVLNVVAIVLCRIRFAHGRKIPQEDNSILGMY